MILDVTFLRHGLTEEADRLNGSRDVALLVSPSSAWRQHLLPRLAPRGLAPPDFIVSSPLQRCRLGAEVLADGRQIFFHDGFQERHFGRWEGQSLLALGAADPQWSEHLANDAHTPPEGESASAFAARVESAWQACLVAARQHDPLPAHILVVTHGGVIQALLAKLLGLNLRQARSLHVQRGGFARLCLADGRSWLTALEAGS